MVDGHKVRELNLWIYSSERANKGWLNATEKEIRETEDLIKRLTPKDVIHGLKLVSNLNRKKELVDQGKLRKKWGRPSKVEELVGKIKWKKEWMKKCIKNNDVLKFYENLLKNGVSKKEVIKKFKKHQQDNIDKLLSEVSYPTRRKIITLLKKEGMVNKED